MNGRDRIDEAMRLRQPDRVPVMCQLALGHYFLNTGFGAVEIWHSTEAFAEALIELQRRYGFDGILVNLPGRDPNWRRHVHSIEKNGGGDIVRWVDGSYTVCPEDDNPHVYRPDGTRWFPTFDELDPDKLFYVEQHDVAGVTYPQSFGFEGGPATPGKDFFPLWHFDTVRYVAQRVGAEISIHGEVFSPFSQFMDMLDYQNALLALIDDPGKVKACLGALVEGAVALGCGLARAGANAILISSAFAGAGFLSRAHYAEFVLPYETAVIAGIRRQVDVPVYTHTCGAIGDRLDLMAASGTRGIDTLDPPPLGTVEIADAKRQLGGRLFIKGNLDPVNTLLLGTIHDVRDAARERIAVAGPGGGYILSSACSVAPATPPANIAVLREVAEECGRYPMVAVAAR
jgi:uroporphyrinogen-III decarboxylase